MSRFKAFFSLMHLRIFTVKYLWPVLQRSLSTQRLSKDTFQDTQHMSLAHRGTNGNNVLSKTKRGPAVRSTKPVVAEAKVVLGRAGLTVAAGSSATSEKCFAPDYPSSHRKTASNKSGTFLPGSLLTLLISQIHVLAIFWVSENQDSLIPEKIAHCYLFL